MQPIPKHLLIHTATHNEINSVNTWGVESLTSTSIDLVRIEPYSEVKLSKTNDEKIARSIMFYDCVNSTPSAHTFNLKDHIVFNGSDMQILKIDDLYDDKKLHHYEIILG